jgi:hypothetical protein
MEYDYLTVGLIDHLLAPRESPAEEALCLDIAARIARFGVMEKCKKCCRGCKQGKTPRGTKTRFICHDFAPA